MLAKGQHNQGSSYCRSDKAQRERSSHTSGKSLKYSSSISLLCSHPSVRKEMFLVQPLHIFKFIKSQYFHANILVPYSFNYVEPHAEQWLSSSQPPTSASVTFCRLLHVLFFFFFSLNICRNIHFEIRAESFRTPGSSSVGQLLVTKQSNLTHLPIQ